MSAGHVEHESREDPRKRLMTRRLHGKAGAAAVAVDRRLRRGGSVSGTGRANTGVAAAPVVQCLRFAGRTGGARQCCLPDLCHRPWITRENTAGWEDKDGHGECSDDATAR